MKNLWKYSLGALAICIAALFPSAKAFAGNIEPTGAYTGIQIDGSFADWEGTTRYPGNMDGLNYSTMVYDGDMLYFYFEFSENPNRITWSGPNWNGQFSVTNNYGEQMLFQLTGDPNNRVLGVEGASFAANTTDWMGESYIYKWEIGIPASNLRSADIPGHNTSLSFGYYLGASYIVENVGNINDDGNAQPGGGDDPGNTDPTPTGGTIVYDGQDEDWNSFAMTTIQYATAGTDNHSVDAEGALYFDDVLYGYVRTTIPEHLVEGGGEFTGSTIIKLNNNDSYTFRAQYVAVDSQGNINYSPELQSLPYGTYEFYIIDSAGWKSAENIADWDRDGDFRKGTNAVYGKAMITIGPSQDTMEYYMNVDKLTEKFGLSPDEARTFSALYERLGQQWVNCAGASTGPLLGISLCVITTGFVLWRRKKRGIDIA